MTTWNWLHIQKGFHVCIGSLNLGKFVHICKPSVVFSSISFHVRSPRDCGKELTLLYRQNVGSAEFSSCPLSECKGGEDRNSNFSSYIFNLQYVFLEYLYWLGQRLCSFPNQWENHKMKLMEITRDLAGPYICYYKCSMHSCSRAVLVIGMEKQLTTLEKSGVSSFHRDLTPSRLVARAAWWNSR